MFTLSCFYLVFSKRISIWEYQAVKKEFCHSEELAMKNLLSYMLRRRDSSLSSE